VAGISDRSKKVWKKAEEFFERDFAAG
jgi:hypothetical protein